MLIHSLVAVSCVACWRQHADVNKQPMQSLVTITGRLAVRATDTQAGRVAPVIYADAAHVPEMHRRDAVPGLYLVLPPVAQWRASSRHFLRRAKHA